MPSCLLFYGPGARQYAIDEANRIGRLMAPPFGDNGLKAAEARDVTRMMGDTPIGESISTLVIGPMDLALPKSSDALLKSIEEFDGSRIQPILWAHDVAGIAPTVRSRCHSKWVDIPDGEEDQELVDAGFDIVDAIAENNLYHIPVLVGDFKGREHDLIGSIADALSTDDRPVCHRIWGYLRPVAELRNPTDIEVIAALVGCVGGD